MTMEELRIVVEGHGSVGATLGVPGSPALPIGVVLAHGAGNDRFGPLLVHVQRGLVQHRCVCATFNFPYKEQGRRLPDPLPVLMQAYRDVLQYLRRRFVKRTNGWVLGGKSLGGRVASYLAAEGEAVSGLLFLGYPLHPAGKPERLRVDHLSRIRVPMLFVQGTRDALCELPVLEQVLRELRGRHRCRAELVVIEGGDHSFVVPRTLGRRQEDVYDDVVRQVVRWLRTLGGPSLRPARREP